MSKLLNAAMSATKNATENMKAVLLTQYERYGSIGKDEVRECYIDEELKPNIDISYLDDYNEYLSENNYETYFGFDVLNEILSNMQPLDIIKLSHFGDFNYSDDYVKFNGYGNLDSFSDYQIVEEMKADRDFLNWLMDNDDDLIDFDSEEIQNDIAQANELLALGY